MLIKCTIDDHCCITLMWLPFRITTATSLLTTQRRLCNSVTLFWIQLTAIFTDTRGWECSNSKCRKKQTADWEQPYCLYCGTVYSSECFVLFCSTVRLNSERIFVVVTFVVCPRIC